MKGKSEREIRGFRDGRLLVGIQRQEIDPNPIHGVIVDYDRKWILLRQIFDFFPDGWVLLRRDDITEIQSTSTDAFHKKLMLEEGTWAQIDFSAKVPAGGVPELLGGFRNHRVIIAEEKGEDGEMFHIGYLKHIDEDEMHLHRFHGDGLFEKGGTIVTLDEVALISYDTNYALHYQRHFERIRGGI